MSQHTEALPVIVCAGVKDSVCLLFILSSIYLPAKLLLPDHQSYSCQLCWCVHLLLCGNLASNRKVSVYSLYCISMCWSVIAYLRLWFSSKMVLKS